MWLRWWIGDRESTLGYPGSPMSSHESLITEDVFRRYSERSVKMEEGSKKCHVIGFENGERDLGCDRPAPAALRHCSCTCQTGCWHWVYVIRPFMLALSLCQPPFCTRHPSLPQQDWGPPPLSSQHVLSVRGIGCTLQWFLGAKNMMYCHLLWNCNWYFISNNKNI